MHLAGNDPKGLAVENEVVAFDPEPVQASFSVSTPEQR
jgi:hypothetical protein